MTASKRDTSSSLEVGYPAIAGGLAGLLATVPMTMVMVRLHRRLPLGQRYALPPRIITDAVAESVPLPVRLMPERGPDRALAAHFAFGAATGALYGILASRTSGKPGIGSGFAFGLSVWATSYLGWVPAAGLMPPATRQPARRNAMMVAAHIVWGAVLGAVTSATLRAETRKGRG